ncbi:hypothetical protein ACH9EU_03410 [Kocuria sp. M1R5S2]|uniref:hypothetical protein n=1 Tax=Kocuria rhizosphaerae TaxID=3376285 RepID=UPI0037A4DFA8
MTSHETNPYRQKVDELLEQQAAAAERRDRDRKGDRAKMQETIANSEGRLNKNVSLMRDEFVRLYVRTAPLQGVDEDGWKLDDRFAIGQSGTFYYYPPTTLHPSRGGQGAPHEWARFDLREQMGNPNGVVAYSQWHKDNIKIDARNLMFDFFPYLDDCFDKVVKESMRSR